MSTLEIIPPPTVIVVHPRENRKKCSVEPLRGREGFQFQTFNGQSTLNFPENNYVRLGLGGPILGPSDAALGLLVLDGTWRWAEAMETQYSHVPVRSLPPWQTAYPRVSKVFEDPQHGLATIEAVWLAYWCVGRSTAGLLDHYRWGQRFLELNADFLESRNAIGT
jgi:pre-rRNA-processing protein TSR3